VRLQTYQIIKKIGSTRLVSYASDVKQYDNIILIIPSLINKYYILDLYKDNSLIEFLSENTAVFLIEFDDPIVTEFNYGLSDYLDKIVSKYFTYLLEKYNMSINILGHCLGSILAIMLCQKFPHGTNKMILISPPFDMSYITYHDVIDYMKLNLKLLHSDIVDKSIIYNFTILANYKKFIECYSKTKITKYYYIDQWSRDGINLTAKLAKEIILELYDNSLVLGSTISNTKINFANILNKTLIIAAEQDMLVPYLSSTSLNNILPNSEVITVESGHVGIVIGSNAKTQCWQPMVNFL
jgi:polyhydroxyalkanoate synthase subunit PhaC